ncbi:MAG: hypothetical protein ACPG06_02790 [Alphaproteobacteria bacterium]
MLLTFHIIIASAWLGLVAGETAMELMAKSRETKSFVAQVHRTIDIYVEGPLMSLTLITGSILLWDIWPEVSTLLLVKVAAGVIAVIANVICIHWVIERARATTDEAFKGWAAKIKLTGYTIPFAVVALGLGIYGV